jgi:carbonic anhydrase
LRHDIPASLVVFLVALPLSLGIAIASGAPLMAGLIAAVVGGIVAGAIGGSALQVSGPAAGLTVVVAGLIDEFGWQMTCLITVAAGALQILFGLSRIARAALAVAPVVVHAMLAGIGVTITLQQIHVLLGGSSHSSAWKNIVALPQGIVGHDPQDAIIGGLVIAILLLWSRLPAKVRMIPGALVAIVVATAFAMVAGLHSANRVALSGSFFDAIGLPRLPATAPGGEAWVAEVPELLIGVLTIAIIASVESLLSAVAIDKLHTGPRTNFDREMIGQGSANLVSGLLGGLPVTGVIVRSSTNVAAGARTRTSAVLHGVWILLFATLLTRLVDLIPKAALAGLLIVIGLQLVKLAHIKVAWRTGNFAVYTITIAGVVFLNLLEGVAIGLALAIAMLLVRVLRAPIVAKPDGGEESNRWRVDIDGTLSFLLLPRLTKVLSMLPRGSDVTLTLNADYIDDAISEAISDWKHAHEATGGTVEIIETSPAKLHDAHTSPPKRHYPRTGVLHRHVAELADSHEPDTLFLTCGDSRVLPNFITASGPGELYTVRNVGNLVPTDPADGSVDAALDQAVNQFSVSSVVVCGHSSCGAMKALLQDVTDQPKTPMRRWLDNARESLVAYQDHHPARVSAESCGFNEVDQLGLVNVAVQVDRLTRHPILAAAVASGGLQVVGMFFDISTVRVYEVDQNGTVRPAEPAGTQ